LFIAGLQPVRHNPASNAKIAVVNLVRIFTVYPLPKFVRD
jgi:hypothetical protein